MSFHHEQLFIGGAWKYPVGSERIEVFSASTEEVVGSVPLAVNADVDAAVAAARQAFDGGSWSSLEPGVRADYLNRFADALAKRSEETAQMVTRQNGMPITLARMAEGDGPVGLLRYYAELARTTEAEESRRSIGGYGTTVVRREPIGVVAAISPWNYPAILAMFKIAPALAAGCTVVLKPSPETVLDSFILAEAAIEAGLPAETLNIITGGVEIGQYLVAHPDVDKVAFTGSTAAGRQIARTCGELLRPVTLELGGKSAAIILDDADISSAAKGLATASLLNSGQTCYMSTRILAPRSHYSEVVDAVTAMAAGLTVGDPFEASTAVGPLINQRQRDRVESYIEVGQAEGARLTTGGARPAGFDRGWYVQPTVFAEVDNNFRIAREEIFGPVLAVIAYESEADAVAIANDSDYGLGGTVWTTDPDRGLNVARKVRTGSLGINNFALDIGSPFGGVKASGLGRELGPEGLSAYLTTKSIYQFDTE